MKIKTFFFSYLLISLIKVKLSADGTKIGKKQKSLLNMKIKKILIFSGLLVGFYSSVRLPKSYFGLVVFGSNTIKSFK
ncbi:hypothetical protein BpHYR1_036800 [Brachionus plicatilis]|uniref:Uncharacterized protein n=1 Tax=Brachionus plicatilis TaxID=10195 RepID=A0A3M7RYK3_BRAPC|nr:hypothetical protein BpHYR1_036800 [Brachionus plicatilis]